jgi:hypothetical protein
MKKTRLFLKMVYISYYYTFFMAETKKLLELSDFVNMGLFYGANGSPLSYRSFWRYSNKGIIKTKKIESRIFISLSEILRIVPNYKEEAPYIPISLAKKKYEIGVSSPTIIRGIASGRIPGVQFGKDRNVFVSEKWCKNLIG